MFLGSELASTSFRKCSPSYQKYRGDDISPDSRRLSDGWRRIRNPIHSSTRFQNQRGGSQQASGSPIVQRRPSQRIIKLNDCTHFHYEFVELGPVYVKHLSSRIEPPDKITYYDFSVESNKKKWVITRTFEELVEFDQQLHRCVFDRRHSRLSELSIDTDGQSSEASTHTNDVISYVNRLSQLTGSLMRCYPVLRFLELDSQGNRFVPIEQSQINVPAVSVAVAIKPFDATKANQLTLKIGDIVSVVDMGVEGNSSDESYHSGKIGTRTANWWKGKLTIPGEGKSPDSTSASFSEHNTDELYESASEFAGSKMIGYFPSSCVRLLSEKMAVDEREQKRQVQHPTRLDHHWWPHSERRSITEKRQRSYKSLLDFVTPRSHVASFSVGSVSAEGRQQMFGVDLEKYLSSAGLDVPLILTECIRIIEEHGVVTGIYRQCGIQSNIRKIRSEFDAGTVPIWDRSILNNDIHCVSSLLKQYFRLLPNSLFTSQLYHRLIEAYTSDGEIFDRIKKVRDVVVDLPKGHFRTAKCLITHLYDIAKRKHITDMNASNLAIVWAPNLIWCPPKNAADNSHLLMGLDLHKSLCNFMILYSKAIFDENNNEISSDMIDDLSDSETTIEQNEYFGHKNRMKSKQRGNNSISNLKDGQCIDILINDVSTTMGGMYRHRDSFSTWRNFTAGDVSFESSISSVPDRNRNKSKSPLFHELRSRSVDCVRRSESVLCHLGKNLNQFGSNIMQKMRPSIKEKGHRRGFGKDEGSHELINESSNNDSSSNEMTQKGGPGTYNRVQMRIQSVRERLARAKEKRRPRVSYLGEFPSAEEIESETEGSHSSTCYSIRSTGHRMPVDAMKSDQKQTRGRTREKANLPPSTMKMPSTVDSIVEQVQLQKELSSSRESLPLDVSRYENVQNCVPRSSTNRHSKRTPSLQSSQTIASASSSDIVILPATSKEKPSTKKLPKESEIFYI